MRRSDRIRQVRTFASLPIDKRKEKSQQQASREDCDGEPNAKRFKVQHNTPTFKKSTAFMSIGNKAVHETTSLDCAAVMTKFVTGPMKPEKVVSTTETHRVSSDKMTNLGSQPENSSLDMDIIKVGLCDGSKENDNVNEPPVSESDDEQNELLNYIKIRERNIKANEDFFASLGVNKAKEMLQLSTAKKKAQPTQRGLKVHKELQEPNPSRYSLRIRSLDPVGNALPEPDPLPEPVEESRLTAGPIGMKECAYSKNDKIALEYVQSVSSILCCQKPSNIVPAASTNIFNTALKKVTITERRVAKVVPGRAFSICWHPSSKSLICAAGDKNGYIGIWDVTAAETTGQDIVRVFRPHIKPVSDLVIPPADSHKLYSCSYDSSLRCGNFEREVFDEVFSVPEKNDDLFRNLSFIDSSNTMLVSQFSGNVSLVDVRTPTTCAEQVYHVSRKSLRTVSVHPTQPNYFITAGVEPKIILWDLRSMSSKSPKPVQILQHHTKAISCAYFSPTGHKILSSSADDSIHIYSVDNGMKLDLSKQIRHNNHTGRWLTKFQPNWHPTVKDVFVSGSMHRPRQIEVYNAEGELLKALSDEDFLGSVCSLNVFHPNEICTLVGANSSGRLHVFM